MKYVYIIKTINVVQRNNGDQIFSLFQYKMNGNCFFFLVLVSTKLR